MKTSALFLSVATVALKTALVQSAECTIAELTTISGIYSSASSKGMAACPDLTSTTDVTASDYCSNSDCLQFMSDMLDGFPDCSSSGVNLKQGLQSAVDYCTSGTTDMSGVFTDTSTSSAFATDASSGSALTTASSSSSSSLRTASSSTGTTTGSTTSDKVTANTVPPATASGSSAAPVIGMTISSAMCAATAFALAVAL